MTPFLFNFFGFFFFLYLFVRIDDGNERYGQDEEANKISYEETLESAFQQKLQKYDKPSLQKNELLKKHAGMKKNLEKKIKRKCRK